MYHKIIFYQNLLYNVNMKNIILTILFISIFITSANANLVSEHNIQTKIDSIGTNILNTNKIQTHIIFTYDKNTRKNLFKTIKGLNKNRIIVYDGIYQYAETDDELAAALAQQIYFVSKIYSNFGNKFSYAKDSKLYESIIDKKTVDYMVNAGYNPLALITFLNKTNSEYKFSLKHNKTSSRLVTIYEYILLKYPQYLKDDNPYLDNQYFQNFLLNTIFERKLLQEKLNKQKGNI